MEWSQFAIADREAIFDYIEADNPKAAGVMDDRIRRHIEQLQQFPESGRPGRIEGTRELVIDHTLHRGISDRRQKKYASFVLHGARLWPEEVSEP